MKERVTECLQIELLKHISEINFEIIHNITLYNITELTDNINIIKLTNITSSFILFRFTRHIFTVYRCNWIQDKTYLIILYEQSKITKEVYHKYYWCRYSRTNNLQRQSTRAPAPRHDN